MMMARKHFRIAALVLALAAPMVRAHAQGFPAEPGDGIADLANVISAAQADSIRSVLHALRADPGVEVRVLTIPSLADQERAGSTVEEFATAVYNTWKLGYGQRNDGVLVLVSVGDRRARIELGDGVPLSQDERMQRLMNERMVPRFREGDYGAGVVDGVAAIAESFRDSTAFAATPAYTPNTAYQAPSAPTPMPSTEGPPLIITAILAALGLGGAVAAWRAHQRRKPRPCTNCRTMMARLDEEADDVHLDSGRRLEEVMGSVDYDVWSCPACHNAEVLRYPGLLSAKEQCPGCGYRTIVVQKRTLQSPTYSQEGLQQVSRDCRHCAYHDEDTIRLPRLQRSTTTTHSGGGSSFGSSSGFSGGGGGGGGGSSSGRGASGGW